MKKEMIVTVDINDKDLGVQEKDECHLGKGVLHRAFLLMVFNEKGEVLLAKRSQNKKLWPNYWDCSVASHIHEMESYEDAARRRFKQELGVDSKEINFLFKFIYHSTFAKVGSESEICGILSTKVEGELSPNPEEISEWEFISIEELKKDIKASPEKYTPWLLIALKKIEDENLWNRLL